MHFSRFSRRWIISSTIRGIATISLIPFCKGSAWSLTDRSHGQKSSSNRCDPVNAAGFGYHRDDATNALQQAISSGAKRVFVPNMGQPWIVKPLFLESNQVIEFEDGVVVLAQEGAFKGEHDCLFKAVNKENITLHGTNVAFKMNRKKYSKRRYKKAEWRHCLSLLGCRKIFIQGLSFLESGGDGIYVGRGVGKNSRTYCEDIQINNVICSKNHRQGLSIISARNLSVKNSIFKNTKGTSPQSGIDFEPNRKDEILENCNILDSVIMGNKSYGILFALGRLTRRSNPISIRIENCKIRNNGRFAIHTKHPFPENSPSGVIKLKNNLIGDRCNFSHLPGVKLVVSHVDK